MFQNDPQILGPRGKWVVWSKLGPRSCVGAGSESGQYPGRVRSENRHIMEWGERKWTSVTFCRAKQKNESGGVRPYPLDGALQRRTTDFLKSQHLLQQVLHTKGPGVCARYHAEHEKPLPQLIHPGLGLATTVWSRKLRNQVFATDKGLPEYLAPRNIPQRKFSPHVLKATPPAEAELGFSTSSTSWESTGHHSQWATPSAQPLLNSPQIKTEDKASL